MWHQVFLSRSGLNGGSPLPRKVSFSLAATSSIFRSESSTFGHSLGAPLSPALFDLPFHPLPFMNARRATPHTLGSTAYGRPLMKRFPRHSPPMDETRVDEAQTRRIKVTPNRRIVSIDLNPRMEPDYVGRQIFLSRASAIPNIFT